MHSISDIKEKIKGFRDSQPLKLRTIPDDIFLGLIIILVAFGSFGLGRLSKIEGTKTPVRFENLEEATSTPRAPAQKSISTQGASVINAAGGTTELVGSKNGTKYYYPWCSGVKNISPSNLMHFASKTDAEARGYTPSKTCKGL